MKLVGLTNRTAYKKHRQSGFFKSYTCSYTVQVKVRRFYFVCYLSYELHDEVHHQLGVLVEHALPQLVHHPLSEVEDVVDQDLITAAAAEGQGGIFTCTETGSKRNCFSTTED